jgi:hypothetical protein
MMESCEHGNEPSSITKSGEFTNSHSFIHFIHVHFYPTRFGNPLNVEQVRVRNAYTHINEITAIK